MSASSAIKQRLVDLNMNQIDLAKNLGITKQNLNNKLTRDSFDSRELEKICKILNMKLVMIDENLKEYVIEYNE